MTADQVEEGRQRLARSLPDPLARRLIDLGAKDLGALAGELRYVETTFLKMQQNIFDDLAWQHVAYQRGGMAALGALHDRDSLKKVHLGAWREIDSRDAARVQRGNLRLLRYEQEKIIGDDYDAIRDHSEVTWLSTLGMSVVAESPIDGGRPFREVVPYDVKPTVNTPRIPLVPDRLVPDRVPFTDVPVPGGGGVSIDTPDQVTGRFHGDHWVAPARRGRSHLEHQSPRPDRRGVLSQRHRLVVRGGRGAGACLTPCVDTCRTPVPRSPLCGRGREAS